MKLKKFKVGDKVRLVKHGKIGQEAEEWSRLKAINLSLF